MYIEYDLFKAALQTEPRRLITTTVESGGERKRKDSRRLVPPYAWDDIQSDRAAYRIRPFNG